MQAQELAKQVLRDRPHELRAKAKFMGVLGNAGDVTSANATH